MKNQIVRWKHSLFGEQASGLSFDFGWAIRVLICGVLVGCFAETNGWGQLPESATLNQAALNQAALEEAEQGDDPTVPKNDLTVETLKQLSTNAQSLLGSAAEAVVSMDGGSGVIVSKDGWVLTASHVCVSPGRQIQVRLSNGVMWPAKTFGVDRQKDTGMVKLLGDHVWPFVKVKKQIPVQPGDWCVVMGYPWDTERLKTPAVRLGRVTAVSQNRIVTDVPIIGGDSGGPVFNSAGDLLAINSRIRLDVNQNIHIPVATFTEQFDVLTRAAFVRNTGVRKKEVIDDSLPQKLGRNSAEVRRTVANLIASKQVSVVRLVPIKQGVPQDNQQRDVLGTIVTESGLVVAKQTELRLPVKARVNGDWVDAEMVAFDRTTDLALLQLKPKADAKFVPLPIDEDVTKKSLVGQLILSVVKSAKDDLLTASLGTIMVEPQSFNATAQRQDVDLGLVLVEQTRRSTRATGVDISRVYPESLAAQSGLRNGDRLISINGRDVVDAAGLAKILAELDGGQQIRFSIRRQSELLSFRVRLPARLPLVWDRWGGGPFSGRRFGFGTVIAHDGVIDPSDCGGPVIDLNGKFVGVNVSRAMRTTTYVVPAPKVQALVQRYLRSQ